MDADLAALDLNLLRVFDHLRRERSVSRTAERLGVGQPAVSNALARLRRQLGDDLFVRTPQGMQPTPRAEAMAAPVAEALALMARALQPAARFAPAASDRTFTLGMTDIGEIVFLPALLQHLAQAAPGVRLSTVRNGGQGAAPDLRQAMANGEVDAAIGLLPQLQDGFHQRALFRQRYVCLFRAGHRLAALRRVSLKAFCAEEHVVVVAAGTGHHQVDELLIRQGVSRAVRLTVPHFVAVGHILASTDLVATVPVRLAEQMAGPFGLAFAEHPAALAEVPINLFWHARLHRDPAHQWLRGQIVGLFGSRGAKAPA